MGKKNVFPSLLLEAAGANKLLITGISIMPSPDLAAGPHTICFATDGREHGQVRGPAAAGGLHALVLCSLRATGGLQPIACGLLSA